MLRAIALILALTGITRADEAPLLMLPVAVLQDNADVVAAHAAAGTDLNALDPYGSRPLTIAATFGSMNALQALIQGGADLEARDAQGSTALHIAAFFGRTRMVETLLSAGADPLARNGDGSTALDIVLAPFASDVPIYDTLAKALGPLGLTLDYGAIAAARPGIAALLRPDPEVLAKVDFTPPPDTPFPVVKAEKALLDRAALAELYYEAGHLENIYGLLVLRGGAAVAERYFNGNGPDQLSTRHSITKSVLSALYGIALEQGCAPSLDANLIDYFPEIADQIGDPRKKTITMRQALQMRSGFPMETTNPPLHDALFFSEDWDWIPHFADFPLATDPGTTFAYSNLTSQLIAIALQRACSTDLKSFGQDNLFSPIGGTVASWSADPQGYSMGWGELTITARDMARFGQLYLNFGFHDGKTVVPPEWVSASSLDSYSEDAWTTPRLGRHIGGVGYGYQWWSGQAGNTAFVFAWGHGGQIIALIPRHALVIVATADPQFGLDPAKGEGWDKEQAILNLVGKYIATLGVRP
ncbi:serine hydrolase [Marimonas arenosa]|uniref:Serine hydrolase n=1 Tax=Marimonas arenosa TaxID=1795305 RepID=A0AAE3WDN3_9RHOB|nr:serine hydrolase [Marimonas arenosa]